MLPWPLVIWPPVGPASAIPPPPSKTTPLSSTIRQLDTSWRFLFRHRFQRNSTLPSCRWKLPIMACPPYRSALPLSRAARTAPAHLANLHRLASMIRVACALRLATRRQLCLPALCLSWLPPLGDLPTIGQADSQETRQRRDNRLPPVWQGEQFFRES